MRTILIPVNLQNGANLEYEGSLWGCGEGDSKGKIRHLASRRFATYDSHRRMGESSNSLSEFDGVNWCERGGFISSLKM